jgi:ELWxxDGT repeat protein
MRPLALAVLLSLAAPLALHAQSPYLVKDINAIATSSPVSSNPSNFFRFGSRIYFAATVQGSGIELWSTDGTEAGTAQVADINPGSPSSSPSRFAELNGKLIFNASDGRVGNELWTSDGTAAGTRLLADIRPGFASSSPGERIVYHGQMIFAADDGIDGYELWITDGTPAGTRFLKDLLPGPTQGDPRGFVLFHDLVYFSANNGLWKSDGTEAGTTQVNVGGQVTDLVIAGSKMFFAGYSEATGNELWVSDGTAAGTRMITEINPGPVTSVVYASGITPFGDRVLFRASDPEHGSELWISDGTAAGTHVVRDIVAGSGSSFPTQPVVTDRGVAFFTANTESTGEELWKTDGTENGTVLVRDIVPGPDKSSITSLVAAGGKIYFLAALDRITRTLWTSDGTNSGTMPVSTKNLTIFANSALTVIDNIIYFAGANSLNGVEPWKSDGSDAGTSMIRNLGRDAAPSSRPVGLIAAGDWVYFEAWDGTGSSSNNGFANSMWRSDGTAEGTLRIADFLGQYFTTAGHSLYFTNSNVGWTSNGTPEGTSALVLPNDVPKLPTFAFANGNTLFFWGHDGDNLQLYAVTPPNPVPEPLGISGYQFINQAGRTLFIGPGGLWSSDGTRAGTYAIGPTITENVPALASMGGSTYYVTQSSDGSSKLWRNDGTVESTVLIKSLAAAASVLTAADRRLFFLSGGKLWVSDGTEAGTQALTAGTTYLSSFAVTGGRAVFTDFDPATGLELWVSDGTVAGTHLLRDIFPGTFGSSPTDLTSVRGSVYFSALDDLHGDEIWITDGTPEGTKFVADVELGFSSSSPRQFVEAGDRLFFSATTAATGNELWALPLSSAPRLSVNDIRVPEGDSGTSTARFTVTLSAPSAQPVTVDYATSDGTALSGSDYDTASGTLTFAAGETSKNVDIRVHGDVTAESNEAFFFTLRNPSGAALQKSSAVAIIDDDDQVADLSLALEFSTFSSLNVSINAANNGPRAATNIRYMTTATPADNGTPCATGCGAPQQLASGAAARAFGIGWPGYQQYLTATASIHERDPQPSNNSVAWMTNVYMAMDALFLTPGSQANVWFTAYNASSVSITSSNPAVISVPSSLAVTSGQPATIVAHGVSAGSATIRVFTPTATVGTLNVDVVPSGTTPRWPGAIFAYADNGGIAFDSPMGFSIYTNATAPYSGARATGTVTISANGQELGRVTLKPGVNLQRIVNYLPALGDNAVRIDYSGDANFLPSSKTLNLPVTIGRATILGGAERIRTTAKVHVRVTGSPVAAPTGTVTISEAGLIPATVVALTAGAPGEGQADIDLPNISAGPHTLVFTYSGDTRYGPSVQSARMIEARVRSVKH